MVGWRVGMELDTIAKYDLARPLANKPFRSACYAPHTTLYFTMSGNVQVCCWNHKFSLGNVADQTIDEMWNGEKMRELRRSLERYDLRLGCGFCSSQIENGWVEGAKMKVFDHLPLDDADLQWPKRMDFSLSNSCNLECIMCTGTFSSAIRAHRERLPPTRKYYTDDFIKSLRRYVPHLTHAKFLGGEPFLITEYYQIWQTMVEDAPHVRCHITTNGTQYNSRVQYYMDRLNFSFAISLDGATKATVESIRVNANFEEQRNNLSRLRDYTRERKTSLALTFCFMRQNWHEFGEFCLLADHWDCNVGVNTVTTPANLSVDNLAEGELGQIVRRMEEQAPELENKLRRNKAVWFGELRRLQLKYAAARMPPVANA